MTLNDKELAQKRSNAVVASALEQQADCMITACPLCRYNLVANATENQICFQFCHIFVKTMKNPPENGRIFQESKRLAPRMPNHAIFTAASRAIFIMLVKVVCRSAGESSSPVTRLSEMEQMARARLPV